MFNNNKLALEAFEKMKESLTEAVMKEVGQKLIQEGDKNQKEFIKKLTGFKEELKKEIIEELKK